MPQFLELQKSFQMIANSNQFPGNWFSEIQFSTFAWEKIPDKACLLLGNGFEDRFGVRVSLLLVLIGSAGIYVEIINAFEYVQGARNGLKAEK